jgi:hypothetical protein
VVAKYAGLDQRFGYLPGAAGGSFQPLFDVTSNCLGATCDDSASFTLAESGPTFRFADRAGGVTWSSRPGNNPDSQDHMVSFLVTGGPDKGAYIIAFEDLPIGGGHDDGESHHGGHRRDRHDGHEGEGHGDDHHRDDGHHGDDDRRGDKGRRGDDNDHHSHGDNHDSDEHGHHGGTSDRDYNDLVVQVTVTSPSEIPEPGGLGLLGAGLLVLSVLLGRSAHV